VTNSNLNSGAKAKHYLIVGPSWVGDMVMAQALFKTLREREPDCTIDVIAPRWSLPIIERMPEVRRGIGLPVGHGDFAFSVRRDLGKGLRQENYDHAIVLPRSFKSALVPYFASAKVRTGFRGEMRYGLLNDIRPLDKSILDQTVKRFVALGLSSGEAPQSMPQPSLTIDPENQQRLIPELGLDISKPVIAMMPGASYGPAKCWPLEYFAELATKLTAQGHQVWVLGGAGDTAAGEQIIAGIDSAKNLCGVTRLEDTVDLLAMCKTAVTNDSGLMHVAAAAGVHVIAMYGSSSPGYTPALTDKKTIHYLDMECSPCFKRECPLGHLKCLRDISVNAVESSVQQALNEQV
jgi:heptosyltransferase-2